MSSVGHHSASARSSPARRRAPAPATVSDRRALYLRLGRVLSWRGERGHGLGSLGRPSSNAHASRNARIASRGVGSELRAEATSRV